MDRARRILAIDPGSRRIGYAVLEAPKRRVRARAWGSLRVDGAGAAAALRRVHDAVERLIVRHRPREFVVERAFVGPGARAALRLAEARAAAIVAAARRGLGVFEYAPAEVRSATVGWARAGKMQVAAALSTALGLARMPDADAADALALAICHLGRRWGIDPWDRGP